MKKKAIIIISISVVLILCIAFIFSNSLKNGSETSSITGTIKDTVSSALQRLGLDINIPKNLINILGHFGEFFLLSAVLTVAAALIFPIDFKNVFTKRLWIYASPIALSVTIAFIDEFIQIFSPGRSSDIMDVLVDSIGAIVANALVMGIIFIIFAIKKNKSKD